jgi:hypothetical protein
MKDELIAWHFDTISAQARSYKQCRHLMWQIQTPPVSCLNKPHHHVEVRPLISAHWSQLPHHSNGHADWEAAGSEHRTAIYAQRSLASDPKHRQMSGFVHKIILWCMEENLCCAIWTTQVTCKDKLASSRRGKWTPWRNGHEVPI